MLFRETILNLEHLNIYQIANDQAQVFFTIFWRKKLILCKVFFKKNIQFCFFISAQSKFRTK
jgi:hypothetical protein